MGTMEDHSGKAKQTDKDNRNYSFTAHWIAAKPMGNPPDASPNRSPCFRPFTSIIASDYYYYYYHHYHSCYYYYYYTAAVTTVTDVATAEGKNSEGPKSIGEGNLITEKSLAFQAAVITTENAQMATRKPAAYPSLILRLMSSSPSPNFFLHAQLRFHWYKVAARFIIKA